MKHLPEHATYQEVLSWASSFLEKNEKEEHVAKWLLMERLDWNITKFIQQRNQSMPIHVRQQFQEDLAEYLRGKPRQYIVGHEWFHEQKFKVTTDTLIPRPETEEWFHKYIKYLPEQSLTVADIGTGSGIIGISHKVNRPQDKVIATDISAEALKVAKYNAEKIEVDVDFREGDLIEPIKEEAFDIIVSNPPYIGEDEQHIMDEEVIAHEPYQALFAENKGLGIYQRLAVDLPSILKPNGEIFLEIGYEQGKSVSDIFQKSFPHSRVIVWKDFSGHDRVVHIKC